MINNSPNVNKTSYHFLSQLSEHWKRVLITTVDIGHLGPVLEQTQIFGGAKPVIGIPTLHSWSLDNDNLYVTKR